MDALSGKPSGGEAVADDRQINSIVALVPAADNEVQVPFDSVAVAANLHQCCIAQIGSCARFHMVLNRRRRMLHGS
jgi:hypothetical protein